MTPLAHTARIARARRGFTLIELLVTMLLTAIVISGTYLMFSSSSEVFHHQELTAENHNNIRFAIEVLKADIARAGYHSTPNASADPWVCPRPSFAVPSLLITDDTLVAPAPPIAFQSLIIVGDLRGLPPFGVQNLTGTSVTLQPDPTLTEDEFEAIFAPSSVIRVTNPDGFSQFAKVGSSNGATHSVTLSTSLLAATSDASCGYTATTVESHEANPVVGVVYRLEPDPDDPKNEKTDLVRWQVNFTEDAAAVVPGTRLVVAEYVVGLQFLALGVDATGSPEEPFVPLEDVSRLVNLSAVNPTAPVMSVADVASAPQRVRYLAYRIETRTRRAVPRRLLVPSDALAEASAEKGYFVLSDGRAAEVRTLQGKVAVPNLILRNLR